MEIDGISLTGRLSACKAEAVFNNSSIEVKWEALRKEGMAKIWVATTNHFNTGGKDEYKLMKQVRVKKGKASISVKEMPSKFYKIVIETPYNFLNRWIVVK
jgi:hypothetical protein